MKTKPCSILYAALVVPSLLHAATYHVSERSGDDQKDGLTTATAWKTLAHACGKVAGGDTVVVQAGVYYEAPQLKTAGTAEKPIKFIADGVEKNKVVITGAIREVREGAAIWKIEDAKLGIASLKATARPARVLADETDLFCYAGLPELKSATLASGIPGPSRGYVYDDKEQRLYVRVEAKDGVADANKRMMKIAPPGIAGPGAERPGDSNFGVLTTGPAFVVLEGFTFETPGFCGVLTTGGGVTVRNSWFLGCRTGVAAPASTGGKTVDDVTIERCDFSQAPVFADVEEIVARARALPPVNGKPVKLAPYYWSMHSSGGSTYEFGVAYNVGARWKIIGNYIHDAVDGVSRWGLGGAKDVEIANNTFERLIDNGIETGDHCGKLNVHHNVFIDVFESLSWDPKGGTPWPGPITFNNNTVLSTVRGGKLWAALDVVPGFLELNCGDDNWKAADMKKVPTSPVAIPGGLSVYNNTIILPNCDFFTFTGLRYRKIEGLRFLNNLVITQRLTPARYHEAADLSGMEFDGNLVAPGLDEGNGPGARFAGPKGQALESAAKLGLTDPARRDFSLTAKSPALGGGVTAKNLPGLSTDIGAFPKGASGKYPPAGPVVEVTPPVTPVKP
jgi:hypothetical protein